MNGFYNFLSRFGFSEDNGRTIGVEIKEFTVSRSTGEIVPKAREFLAMAGIPGSSTWWTHGLSACAIKKRSRRHSDILGVLKDLQDSDSKAVSIAMALGLTRKRLELGYEDMPLDVYPDPRYQRIVEEKGMPKDVLRAACRIAGTHIHLGTSNIQEAILLHNALIPELPALYQMGDHSNGERLELYRKVAAWAGQPTEPPCYENVEHLYVTASHEGWSHDLRDCLHALRISRHGTVEVRVFGIPENYGQLSSWLFYLTTLRSGL